MRDFDTTPPTSEARPRFAPEITRETAAPHESVFWRRAARWGSVHGPRWFVKYAPPVIGWTAAALVPEARRAVRRNLHRVRGPAPALDDARDVLATFGTYASCLAEVLSNDGSAGPTLPSAHVVGDPFMREAAAKGRGLVLVTAHTAGWELAGPLVGASFGLELTIVTHAEPNAEAGRIQDEARRRSGVAIAHVGDPLASLPLLRRLRRGGAVALQMDRMAPGMRTRSVPLLGGTGEVPEGPFRLAQLSGAPVVPVFCSRRGYRDYRIQIFEPRTLERRATEASIDDAAAYVAACMTGFLREHPTQWFQFGGAATAKP